MWNDPCLHGFFLIVAYVVFLLTLVGGISVVCIRSTFAHLIKTWFRSDTAVARVDIYKKAHKIIPIGVYVYRSHGGERD